MSKKNIIILIILVSLSLSGSFVLFSNTPPPNLLTGAVHLLDALPYKDITKGLALGSPPQAHPLINPPEKREEKGGGQAILEIDGTRYQGEVMEKTSVYDFMDKMRDERKIDFTERNYVGIGKFIISINGVKGNGSQNWIYYVNDKKMETGVSNYKINQGDIVSWKYEQNY